MIHAHFFVQIKLMHTFFVAKMIWGHFFIAKTIYAHFFVAKTIYTLRPESFCALKVAIRKVQTFWPLPIRSNRIPKICVRSQNERVLCSIFQFKGCIFAYLIFFVAVFKSRYLKSIKVLLPLFFLTWWEWDRILGVVWNDCMSWIYGGGTEAFQLRKLTSQ